MLHWKEYQYLTDHGETYIFEIRESASTGALGILSYS
jgi:hypothetical protein